MHKSKKLKYIPIANNSMPRIIRKVWKNKSHNQLLITIPNDEGIKEGDYVEVKKVK